MQQRSGVLNSLILSSIIGLGVLLVVACTAPESVTSDSTVPTSMEEPNTVVNYDPDQSVSSDDDRSSEIPTVVIEREAVMIEGEIEQVMETYPLQLMVTTKQGRYYVALRNDTTVIQQGQTVNQNNLRPGMQIQVKGPLSSSDDRAMTAQIIQIQNNE